MTWISVLVVDERDNALSERLDIPRNALVCIDNSAYSLLRFVDPYGDTVFNRSQIPTVLSDLRLLRQSTTDSECRKLFDGLELLCKTCLEEPHRYLKFIGD